MSYRKNVFIVGAGFSAESGAPTVRSFFDVAMDLGRNPSTPLGEGERKVFGRVFDYRQELVAAEARVHLDLDNIEELFSLVEMESRLGVSGAREIKPDLIYVILRTLEVASKGMRHQDLNYLYREGLGQLANKADGNIYDFFTNVVARKWWPLPEGKIARDTIISLNYDMLLEEAMHRNRLAPEYELADDRSVEVDPANVADCRVRLLKLHGSANWSVCGNHRDKIYVLPVARASVENADNNPKCVICKGRAGTRLIVPPTWNKDEFQDHLLPVWKSAAHELESAERIFIIGYSMPETDRFFRYLLAAAIRKNKQLHEVIVVNSNQEDGRRIATLFRRLFEKSRSQSQYSEVARWITDQTFQKQTCQAFPTKLPVW